MTSWKSAAGGQAEGARQETQGVQPGQRPRRPGPKSAFYSTCDGKPSFKPPSQWVQVKEYQVVLCVLREPSGIWLEKRLGQAGGRRCVEAGGLDKRLLLPSIGYDSDKFLNAQIKLQLRRNNFHQILMRKLSILGYVHFTQLCIS